MAESRGRGFGHGPCRNQAIQRNLFFRGEAIARALIGKIEQQERFAVVIHGYSGAEVA